MSIQKDFFTDQGICLVKFSLPPDKSNSSKKACLVGDFNNWDQKENPMKKGKNKIRSATVELKMGNEYHFRYLIDETQWENDTEADKYVPSGFPDSMNSVVVI